MTLGNFNLTHLTLFGVEQAMGVPPAQSLHHPARDPPHLPHSHSLVAALGSYVWFSDHQQQCLVLKITIFSLLKILLTPNLTYA